MNHATLFGIAVLGMAIAGAAAAGQAGVEIKTFRFQPKAIEVEAGTTITWTNRDAIEHSVTAGAPDAPAAAFDSGFFTQGQTFSVAFDKPGAYDYFCARHKSMRGTVTVVE
jgi:amicyanin